MSHKHFTIDERESVFKYLALGFKKSEIARRIRKNRSSVVSVEKLKKILLMENIGLIKLKLFTQVEKKTVELRKNSKILYFYWIFKISLKKGGHQSKSQEELKRTEALISVLRQFTLPLKRVYY